MLILKELKVLCFDTLLEVFILKVLRCVFLTRFSSADSKGLGSERLNVQTSARLNVENAGQGPPPLHHFCKRLTQQGLVGGGPTKDCGERSYGDGKVESSKLKVESSGKQRRKDNLAQRR